jgi:tetratricopeptide (TPR) repeat protein
MDYRMSLKEQHRLDDAIALLRNELAIAPPDSATNDEAIRWLLELDNDVPHPKTRPSGTAATSPTADAKKPRVIDPDDALLWACLEKLPAWDNTEEQLLRRMIEKVPSDQRDAFWQKAEKLTRGTDPRRAKVLGEVMKQMHEPARAIPLLKDAVARLALAPNNNHNDLGYARLHLFEAFMDSGDWREAERIWPEARQLLSDDQWSSRYVQIALAAVKDGDRDDALRMWKRWANADLASSLGDLKKLADAGLREPLRDYYAGIAKRLPASWVPVRAKEVLSSTKPGE